MSAQRDSGGGRSVSSAVYAMRVLLASYGAFWLVGGALAIAGRVDFGLSEGAPVLGALMICNGVAALFGSTLAARGHRAVDYLTLAYLAVNAVLSVTDDIGAYDVASLAVCAAAFGLLIAHQRAKPAEPGPPASPTE